MSIEAIQEYMMFVNEINQGMEQVKQLRASSSCSPNQEAVLDKMVASYTDAASVLAGGSASYTDSVLAGGSASYTDAASVLAGGSSQGQAGAVDLHPLSDGYVWRKYGQKDILGAKYPRGYYRCSISNCPATKQIQRSNEDPPKWKIDYYMKHTCRPVNEPVLLERAPN